MTENTMNTSNSSAALSRFAFKTALAAIGVLLVGALVLLIAYLVGGQEAIDDNWGGFIFMIAFFGSWAMSLLAFVVAIIAKSRKEVGQSLVLPFWFFPVYTLAVVLGELFIFE